MKHGKFTHNTEHLKRAKLVMLASIVFAWLVPFICAAFTRQMLTGDTFVDMDSPQMAGCMTAIFWTFTCGFLAKVIAGITFVLWLRKALTNAKALNPEASMRSNFMNTWSWFIPVINLATPYLVMGSLVDSLPEEDRNKLRLHLFAWSFCWFMQTTPVNFIEAFMIGAIALFVDLVCYSVSGPLMFHLMDKITLAQERELAVQMAAEVPALELDKVAEEGDKPFVVEFKKSGEPEHFPLKFKP